MTRRHLTAALLALALVPASASAASKGAKYQGRTKEGTKISFVLRNGWIEQAYVLLPMTCGSAQGGNPKASLVIWSPPFKFRPSRRIYVKTTDPTRHWHITTHRRGRAITGKLSMNWSLLGSDGFGGYRILVCQATGSFTAKPRAAR